ncbi:hypothetical protein Dester_0874 [Desulfurobacterium thermolithotrophum DSM 11699]|uniref:Flavinylation-associated cytochrome domain-containing protein n=1 Tax=Desulfurobacterium thermolithotrophum (strain DSM 11699 / BSA) TaxID=868864 RepID=F0S3U2_DESTD|nr:DUF4405 domain-containing protein [Desulfurobacterium thermolithotrophum]ADY73514.1 hypothetical protein Dester_0874 [Desulfurobacterium thermolithotrophum DSM 11699]
MLRRYVSLFLLYTLIAMTISGIVLYVMPHGRIAYWTGWRFLGLDKDQWDSLHTIFGFLMVFFGIWHVILNWRNIVSYLKGKAGIFTSKEFFITTIIALTVVVGTIANVPPFKTVMDIGERIKNSWPKPETMPPAPHAELFPLKKVAKAVGLSPQKAIDVLESKGIKVKSPNETLKEIAVKNNTTPARIYEILLGASKKTREFRFQPGSGMGRLTLREVCQELQISPKACLEILKKHGIVADLNQQLRDIAFKNGKYPYQIIEILQGGK